MAESHSPAGGAKTVLLVEDHEDTAEMMCMMLDLQGLQVTSCRTIAEAVRHVGAHRYDILISDIGLPDGTGMELIQRLRAAGVALPAVALSGFGMDSDVAQAKEAGFQVHLTKPVDMARLKPVITSLIGDAGA